MIGSLNHREYVCDALDFLEDITGKDFLGYLYRNYQAETAARINNEVLEDARQSGFSFRTGALVILGALIATNKLKSN